MGTIREASEYLCTMKDKLKDDREIYDTFIKVMKDFGAKRIDQSGVISKVIELFKEHQDLLWGFNNFLPESSKITFPSDHTPPKKPVFRDAIHFVNKAKERLTDPSAFMSFLKILRLHKEGKKSVTEVYDEMFEVLLRDHPDLREDFVLFLPRQ